MSALEGGSDNRVTCGGRWAQTYVQLPHLVFDVALGEVLHVGELEVHLRQPHQDPLTGSLEVLPLRGEVLQEMLGL